MSKRRSYAATACAVLAVFLFVLAGGCVEKLKQRLGWSEGPSDLFGIYTARLDGTDQRLLLSSARNEMTHPRISPDGQWITFTRYNKKGLNGLATEDSLDYQETEIMLMRIDGSDVQSVVPPKKGVIAANSSWTPDGKGLIYISSDNPGRKLSINRIDLQTRRITRLPTPPNLITTDPHWVDDRVVFPVREQEPKGLWMMRPDGSDARRLTDPMMPVPDKKGGFLLGDFDPRISPDGSKVAFMRNFGQENWHVVVIDVETGEERDLSNGKTIDTLPAWSGDGRLIIFWHADRQHPKEIGLYTMRPDGSERRMVPLPRGFVHKHPNFFPGDGFSPAARIIFAAKIDPNLS